MIFIPPLLTRAQSTFDAAKNLQVLVVVIIVVVIMVAVIIVEHTTTGLGEGDRDRERFWGGVKGYGVGDDEVVFNNIGDPHPPMHQDFITLTAAVTVIVSYSAVIATPNGQPHRTRLLRLYIFITSPTPLSLCGLIHTPPPPPSSPPDDAPSLPP